MVTLPKPQQDSSEEIHYFTLAEQKSFIASLDKHRSRALFMLALRAGLRLGELTCLKWKDIDFVHNTININNAVSNIARVDSEGNRAWSVIEHSPKTISSIRTIPVPSTVAAELLRHQDQQDKEKKKNKDIYEDNDLVFATETGNFIDTRNLTRSYQRCTS